MNKHKKRKRLDYSKKIIARQLSEIEQLKNTISKLEIDRTEKDRVIKSIEIIIQEFLSLVDDLKEKKDEYEKLIQEAIEMRNSFDKIVFKGKWSLIRLLIK